MLKVMIVDIDFYPMSIAYLHIGYLYSAVVECHLNTSILLNFLIIEKNIV